METLIVDLDVGVRGPMHWLRRPRAPLFHISWKAEEKIARVRMYFIKCFYLS